MRLNTPPQHSSQTIFTATVVATTTAQQESKGRVCAPKQIVALSSLTLQFRTETLQLVDVPIVR